MKRKKFIKLLQGIGLPRNMAARAAATTRRRGESYAEGMQRWLRIYTPIAPPLVQSFLCKRFNIPPTAGGGEE